MLIWRNIKDFILSYSYPQGQYFLISFPKTGRTWLMHMINQIKRCSKNNDNESQVVIFSEHDNSEIIIENGYRNDSFNIFKFPGRKKYRRSKVIFLVRDPRDVVVSHFHQVTKRAKNPFVFNSISDFVRDENLGFNRIIYYYNLWCKSRCVPKDFLLIRYEDLIKDGIIELKKISDFLSLDVTVYDLKKVYEASSAINMRKEELANELDEYEGIRKDKNHFKVRNAKIGSYMHELDSEDILYCNIKMKDLDPYFKYKI